MALPKKKSSKSRKNMRRANWKARVPAIAKCPHCHQPKKPHAVCPNCGYYAGREVVKPEVEES